MKIQSETNQDLQKAIKTNRETYLAECNELRHAKDKLTAENARLLEQLRLSGNSNDQEVHRLTTILQDIKSEISNL